jgi:hypothetical protein
MLAVFTLAKFVAVEDPSLTICHYQGILKVSSSPSDKDVSENF